MKKKAKNKRKAKHVEKIIINFRVLKPKVKEIKALANRYTRGNVTQLVIGALKYVPQHGAALRKIDCRPHIKR